MVEAVDDSKALKALYKQSRPNQRIRLGALQVQLHASGTVYREKAEVTLEFTPDCYLQLRLPKPAGGVRSWLVLGRNWDLRITVPGSDTEFQAHLRRATVHGSRRPSGLARPKPVAYAPGYETNTPGQSTAPSAGAGAGAARKRSPRRLEQGATFDVDGPIIPTAAAAPLSSAIGHIFNLPDLRAALLDGGGWKVEIRRADPADKPSPQLKDTGGYLLTHAAELTRKDGSEFSDKELSDALECLHWFLSFGFGGRVGVGPVVAYDTARAMVWQQWGLSACARGALDGVPCCFDRLHPEILSGVWPGFRRLWADTRWNQPLRHLLDWYLRANEGKLGLETGIILAPVALDLLAWMYCVHVRATTVREEFKKKPAAERFRLLASGLELPLTFPPSCGQLEKHDGLRAGAGGAPWDPMTAITRVRNSLVHPDPAQTFWPLEVYTQARNLALWYVEISILRLCGHNGNYANRLCLPHWTGAVEPVPFPQAPTALAKSAGAYASAVGCPLPPADQRGPLP